MPSNIQNSFEFDISRQAVLSYQSNIHEAFFFSIQTHSFNWDPLVSKEVDNIAS